MSPMILSLLESMAGTTGLEPATSAVTGQRSNQLSYVPQRNTREKLFMPHEMIDFEQAFISCF